MGPGMGMGMGMGMTPGPMMGMSPGGGGMAPGAGGPEAMGIEGQTTYTGPQPWKAGLFECTNDCGVCCTGLLAFPCLFGCNTSAVRGMGCVRASARPGGVPVPRRGCD